MAKSFVFIVIAVILVTGILAVYIKPGTGTLLLQITDVPPDVNVESVFVTISNVEVHLARGSEEENLTTEANWFTVVEGPKTYELIAIKNVKELLGESELKAGRYTQIRLNVDKAIARINGTEYDLTVPSDKVKLVKTFNIIKDETTTLTLDFNAQESIQSTGRDRYIMRPTIKVIEE